MTKVNLFLPITPYTLTISENLIAKKFHLDDEYENILINPHGLSYNPVFWNQVYFEEASREVSENKIQRYINFAQQIITFLKVYRKIKYMKNIELNFFYVDLAHVLTNAIFFNFKKIKERFIIEDGLLNYYKVTLDGKMLGKQSVNYFLGVLGLRTQNFDGHITGVEMKEVNGQYVFFPKLANRPQKSLVIPYESFSYQKRGNVLIIGQEPIINFIPISGYKQSLEIIIKDFKTTPDLQKVYYKPHHHGKKDLVKDFLKRELREKLVLIEDKSPIHSIVQNIEPSVVISFGSTASLNLKLVLPTFVESWVYLIRDEKLPKNEKMEDLFIRTGIKMKELFLEKLSK
ncbi:polysialyltransferase family glycosyltransferase [Aquimarina sediminis]|uniref:polysialyltransferase family glycosyltransferase n=1 Tax=Aquimarina sediminis TaxID=2070536 RepID=UPI000CA046F0|nr:hypothetical protein [Aquimarina sediminis]